MAESPPFLLKTGFAHCCSASFFIADRLQLGNDTEQFIHEGVVSKKSLNS